MTRNDAINMLTDAVSLTKMAEVIAAKSAQMPHNCTLQMVNKFFPTVSTDTKQNWFTALAVLSINQRLFAGELIQLTRIADGHPELNLREKKALMDAISSGAMLSSVG